MTLYSAFGVNGNGATGPAGSTAFGPGIIQGLSFQVTTTGVQLNGFYYWRADTAQSASASFQLWQITGAGAGSTVAGASASTSSAVAGQWNFVSLITPVTLTSGQEYMAVVGFTGNFSDTHPYFGGAGPDPAGITNGPLYVYRDSTGSGGTAASNPQCAFTTGTANPAASVPASSNTSYNCWIDVQVATGAAGPPTAEPPQIPNPKVLHLLLEEWFQRADWQAQGFADLTVAFASASGGVDTYNVTSPYNNDGTGSHPMRVLAPTAPSGNYPHAFLIMLPVDPNQDTTNGDSIGTAQAIGAHNAYNLTCVQPGYAGVGAEGPWYADNPLNQAIYQETFTLLVTAWIRKNLAVTGQEKVYLIGFSRSGLGGQGLQFRHPDLFAATASWDAPFMMTDYDGTDPTFGGTVGGNPAGSYGTSSNFTTHYELPSNLANWQATGQYGVNRLWIGLGPTFQADVPAYDAALTAAGIPHTYTFANTGESHAWHTDWVAAALAAVIPSYYAGAPTVLPQQMASHPVFLDLLEVWARRMEPGTDLSAASAGAGLAAGAGAAQSPTAGITVSAGLASAAGAAQSPAPAITGAAGLAAGTGTAQSPVPGITAGTGLAAGTGAAQQPVPAVIPAATVAAGTGTAAQPDPAVTPGTGLAAATGTAQPPVPAVAPGAGLASGTGAASTTAASVTVTAGLAAATGTAQQPAAIQFTAGLASAAGTASQPGIAVTVTAGLAHGTGAAANPSIGGATTPAVFAFGDARWAWTFGAARNQ